MKIGKEDVRVEVGMNGVVRWGEARISDSGQRGFQREPIAPERRDWLVAKKSSFAAKIVT